MLLDAMGIPPYGLVLEVILGDGGDFGWLFAEYFFEEVLPEVDGDEFGLGFVFDDAIEAYI